MTERSYKARAYWEQRAASQGRRYVGNAEHDAAQAKRQEEAFLQALEQHVPELVDYILDFGCGVGRLAPWLSARASRYCGVDICSHGLEMCPEIPNAEFHYLDAAVPFGRCQFDSVVAVTVLQHISDKEIGHWLCEIRRVCCPNAKVIIIDHNPIACPIPARHMFPREPSFYVDALQLKGSGMETLMTMNGLSHYVLAGKVAK